MKRVKAKGKPKAVLAAAAKLIRHGAVVIYPTDTAYAIGCDATDAKAAERIYGIKGRDAKKAMPIIVADARMAKKFFKLTASDSRLAARHWPGPLSLVVKASPKIAKKALEKGTAAVRVPASAFACELSRLAGRPLFATSANLSGRPSSYSAAAALRQGLGDAVDMVLDAGALRRRKPSTIVRFGEGGKMEVLRKGPIRI